MAQNEIDIVISDEDLAGHKDEIFAELENTVDPADPSSKVARMLLSTLQGLVSLGASFSGGV